MKVLGFYVYSFSDVFYTDNYRNIPSEKSAIFANYFLSFTIPKSLLFK
jgi:hypothetical protein